jgi:hypothetical protein
MEDRSGSTGASEMTWMPLSLLPSLQSLLGPLVRTTIRILGGSLSWLCPVIQISDIEATFVC